MPESVCPPGVWIARKLAVGAICRAYQSAFSVRGVDRVDQRRTWFVVTPAASTALRPARSRRPKRR